MSKLLTLVLSGIVTGGLYAILSSGLVLTYQVAGVFNFAHGATAFVSALTFFELNSYAHWPIVPAALVTILVFAPLLGTLLDLIMLRKLARAGITAQIVATIGLSIALPAAGLFIVSEAKLKTTDLVTTPPGIGPTPSHVWHLTKLVPFNTDQLAILSAAAFTAVLLWVLVRRTPLGLQMRACVDRRDLASLRGVDPGRSSLVASMLSTTLAGLAGVLGAPLLSLNNPNNYTEAMLVSAAAAVFARFTSIPLAFAFGLALGVAQNLIAGYVSPHVGLTGLSSAAPYILIFIGLLLLNATRGRRAGSVSDEKMRGIDIDRLPAWRRVWPWTAATLVLVVWILVTSSVWLDFTISGLCLAPVFVSFVVVTGVGGMVSLAQAAFVTAAGLSSGLLLSQHHHFLFHSNWPFIAALIFGVLVAAVLGAVVSLPSLRLGGLPLALSTLALAFIGDVMVFQVQKLSNQEAGGWLFPRPKWFGINFDSLTKAGNRNFALLVLAIVLIVVWLVHNLERSPSGRAMLAVRSSPVAAEASGVNTARQKFALFVISSAMAGLGGVLYGSYKGGITNGDHPATEGLIWLAVVVAFGVRKPGGAVMAALIYGMSPHFVDQYITKSTYLPIMLFGLGGIGLAKNPEGFLSDTAEEFRKLGRKFMARRAGPQPARSGSGRVDGAGHVFDGQDRRDGGSGGAYCSRRCDIADQAWRRRTGTRAASGTRPAGRLRRGRSAARHRLRRPCRADRGACSAPTAPARRRCARSSPAWSPTDARHRHPGRRRTARAVPAHKRSRGRSGARPRVAWHLRRADRRGEPAPGARRRPADRGLRALPGAARAAQARGRRALGRRAADADARAAARQAAAGAGRRRAVTRPGAAGRSSR